MLPDQKENDKLIKKYLCHHDQDKNTPLHIAASAQNKIEKIKIIADILKLGTNPKLINKNGESFFSHLKKMPDKWFEELYEDQKLRKIFINLGDDESVSFMFEKFRDLSTTLKNRGEFVKKQQSKKETGV